MRTTIDRLTLAFILAWAGNGMFFAGAAQPSLPAHSAPLFVIYHLMWLVIYLSIGTVLWIWALFNAVKWIRHIWAEFREW